MNSSEINKPPLSLEEWADWQQHPVTKVLHQVLRGRIREFENRWRSGEFTDQSQFGTAILNAKAIGNCEALERVLGLELEDMLGESEDGA